MMMQSDSIAFVLKHYAPKRNVVALLDRRLGRIVAICNREPLSAGTLIAYQLRRQQDRYFIDNIDILHAPFEIAQQHLLFLHHMLEICYYFIPEGSRTSRVYDLLLYVVTDPPMCRQRQKNILFLLFTLLGMYPDEVAICREYAQALQHESFELILATKIDRTIEKYIPRWLYQCITMHACAQNFKTLHYLNEK
jgi:hypothetical protein